MIRGRSKAPGGCPVFPRSPRALGQPVDAVKWLAGWYDWLAMGLAGGISPEKIRGWVKPGSLEMAIIEYIVTYYEVDAWYQAGR